MTQAEQVAQDRDARAFFAHMDNNNITCAERAAKRLGYSINRGSYVSTTDDRINRWYVERDECCVVDRRGSGYVLKRDALRAVAVDLERYV